MREASLLIITADDYGYSPRYDEGILRVAAAGAVDAVSSFAGAGRAPDLAALLATRAEIGLHLDLDDVGEDAEREAEAQIHAFEELYERAPAYLDGHHHSHAQRPASAGIARIARRRGLPVRSVDARHRRTLRCLGVATPDRLVGRSTDAEQALPTEIRAILEGSGPQGVTEWMVHPGHADPASGSSYDAGRERDLRLLLELRDEPALTALRTTHAAAFGPPAPAPAAPTPATSTAPGDSSRQ